MHSRSSTQTHDVHIGPGWHATALVLYVVAGFFLKTILLNWIIGPLFLLVMLHLIPASVRTHRRRERTQ